MLRKGLAVAVILLFIGMCVVPSTAVQELKDISTVSFFGKILHVGGSRPNNYETIQDAIDNASNGDIVYVHDDSSPYYENIFVNKEIKLIGENRKRTVIDGGGVGDVVHIIANNVHLKGFTIQNSGIEYDFDAGVEVESDNNVISFNIISNNNCHGILLNHSSYNKRICHNIIRWNGDEFRQGIRLWNGSNHNNIFSNIIVDNAMDGIALYYSTDNTISRNIISHHSFYGIRNVDYSHNTTISHNIIRYSGTGIQIHETFNGLIYGNIVTNSSVNNAVCWPDCINMSWDNGEIGNYWDDYLERYPNAQPRDDNPDIWDTPYWVIINEEAYDNYPLVGRFVPLILKLEERLINRILDMN